MINIVLAQATKLATSLGMDIGGDELVQTLKATAFKGQVSDAQMAALLIVANQYGLSPWTKEIYAFPDKITESFRLSALMDGRGSSTSTRNLTAWTSSRTQKAVPASFTARIVAGR